MCGASRASTCELDADGPKVNSLADRKPAVPRFHVSVRLRKHVSVRLRKIGRFVLSLRNLPTSVLTRTPTTFRGATPPDLPQL